MSMSDCIKCWETPCACGHEYLHWDEQRLRQQIAMLQGVLDDKKAKQKNAIREVSKVNYGEGNAYSKKSPQDLSYTPR